MSARITSIGAAISLECVARELVSARDEIKMLKNKSELGNLLIEIDILKKSNNDWVEKYNTLFESKISEKPGQVGELMAQVDDLKKKIIELERSDSVQVERMLEESRKMCDDNNKIYVKREKEFIAKIQSLEAATCDCGNKFEAELSQMKHEMTMNWSKLILEMEENHKKEIEDCRTRSATLIVRKEEEEDDSVSRYIEEMKNARVKQLESDALLARRMSEEFEMSDNGRVPSQSYWKGATIEPAIRLNDSPINRIVDLMKTDSNLARMEFGSMSLDRILELIKKINNSDKEYDYLYNLIAKGNSFARNQLFDKLMNDIRY